MKEIEAPEHIMNIIKEIEKNKSNKTMNKNMKSRIIGYSNTGSPSYFVRGDYFKCQSMENEPQEYWSIPNPHDPYMMDKKSKLENMKELMKTEKKLKLKTSTKFYYEQIRDRYNFLNQQRMIRKEEMSERLDNEYVQLIRR